MVLHSYRFRSGSVSGNPALEEMKEQLAKEPQITVPAFVLMGVDDEVDKPQEEAQFASHFTNLRGSKTVAGAGHNIPQEAPGEFVKAILSLL